MRKKDLLTAIAGVVAPALLVTIVCAAPALASEGGHDAPRWGDLAWRFVNLVIFAAILWHFLGKLCKKYFKGRKEKIKEGIDNLTQRREAAQENLAEIERRIANLEAERAAILEESRQQAEALKADIIAQAKAQAQQIVETAKVTAENEGHAIITQIRSTLADELVAATRKELETALAKKGAHDKLINKSLKKVVLQ